MSYKPTCELRIATYSLGVRSLNRPAGWIVHDQRGRHMRVLQQKWVSDVEGEPDQWRDIPLVSGEPHG